MAGISAQAMWLPVFCKFDISWDRNSCFERDSVGHEHHWDRSLNYWGGLDKHSGLMPKMNIKNSNGSSMKKIILKIALLLTITSLFFSLTACSNETSTNDPSMIGVENMDYQTEPCTCSQTPLEE